MRTPAIFFLTFILISSSNALAGKWDFLPKPSSQKIALACVAGTCATGAFAFLYKKFCQSARFLQKKKKYRNKTETVRKTEQSKKVTLTTIKKTIIDILVELLKQYNYDSNNLVVLSKIDAILDQKTANELKALYKKIDYKIVAVDNKQKKIYQQAQEHINFVLTLRAMQK